MQRRAAENRWIFCAGSLHRARRRANYLRLMIHRGAYHTPKNIRVNDFLRSLGDLRGR
jgi:hypothetical protein